MVAFAEPDLECTPWLVTGSLTARDCAHAVVCFPHAGGGASAYASWRRWLPAATALVAVQLPGRENRVHEPCPQSLAEVVTRVSAALSGWSRRPLVLFGHSMGAHLAVATAGVLQAQGIAVRAVVASGSAPTTATAPRPPIADLADREFLARLTEYGGLPDELMSQPGLIDLFLPALRSDVRMNEAWQDDPARPLSCPLVAIGGLSDHRVPAAALSDWREYTTAGFQQRMFSGGHFFIRQHAAEVVALMTGLLTGSLTACGGA